MANPKEIYNVLKWGVVGAGVISSDFVSAVQLTDSNPNHKFVAVASKSLSTAQNFATQHSIPKAYGSYEELAKDSDIQIVYVGNLTSEHFQTAKLFLENGKHVLCEKSMTITLKNTRELIELARAKKLFLMEAMWSRFLPSYKFIREQIQNGAIGEVLYASADFGILLSKERVQQKSLGGGTVLDIGIYALNLLLTAFNNDKPEKILAHGSVNQSGADVNVSAVLGFSNGRTGVISTHSKVIFENVAHIVGTKGRIKLLPMFHCCERVEVNGKLHELLLPDAKNHKFKCSNSQGLKFEADEVRRVLQLGLIESETMSHQHSIDLATIMEEILKQVGVDFNV